MSVEIYLRGNATLGMETKEKKTKNQETFLAFNMLKGQRKQITLHLFVNKRIEVTVASTVTSY